MSRKNRTEKEFAQRIAKEHNITTRQVKKRFVTKSRDMDFLN